LRLTLNKKAVIQKTPFNAAAEFLSDIVERSNGQIENGERNSIFLILPLTTRQ